MSAADDLKLTRDDLLSILNEMSVAIPWDTKAKTNRIRHRLERTLDAAQRYSALFGNEVADVNPSNHPLWDKKKDVTEALYRKCWGGIPMEGEHSRGAFAKMCSLIISLGEGLKQGVREVVFTDEKSTGIIVCVSTIHSIKERRPLIVLGYAVLASFKKMNMKQTIKKFLAKEKNSDIAIVHTARVEQALLLQLLTQNSKHLPPDFAPPVGFGDRYSVSFLLATAWLSMQDVGRLNKTSGCVLCGEPTRSQCGGCKSAQYCGKECQRKHWPDHKFLYRTISSGTWHTITLESNPVAEMSGLFTSCINRYDDLDEATPVSDGQARDKIPPNLYGDNYHMVKLQLPFMGSASHMLIYDRSKSFQLFFRAEKNPDAFIEAVEAMGSWPKIYRWAQRVGDWEWKICSDREPEPTPLW